MVAANDEDVVCVCVCAGIVGGSKLMMGRPAQRRRNFTLKREREDYVECNKRRVCSPRCEEEDRERTISSFLAIIWISLLLQASDAEESRLRRQLPGEATGAEGRPGEREGQGVRGPGPRAGKAGIWTDMLCDNPCLTFNHEKCAI